MKTFEKAYFESKNLDREKELKRLIFIKSELIKETKKEIKQMQQEVDMINGYKKLEKKKVRK
jgi:hypothetical protein